MKNPLDLLTWRQRLIQAVGEGLNCPFCQRPLHHRRAVMLVAWRRVDGGYRCQGYQVLCVDCFDEPQRPGVSGGQDAARIIREKGFQASVVDGRKLWR